MGNTPPAGSPASLPPPENLKTQWDMKVVYKMIAAKQLAPFFPYIPDEDATVHAEECPICLNYVVGGLNRSKCCNKGLCTPCYITIKKTPTTPLGCPFCLGPSLEVVFRGPKTLDQIRSELDDAKKVDDLKRQIREEEIEADRQRALKREKEREEAKLRAEEQERIRLEAQQIKDSGLDDPELEAAMLMSLQMSPPPAPSKAKTPAVTITAKTPSPIPPTPPNSPNAPLPPQKEEHMPQHIFRTLSDPNATDEERDAAQLEAAVWLSLHSGSTSSTTSS